MRTNGSDGAQGIPGLRRPRRAFLDTVVGGGIRGVAVDVSPWADWSRLLDRRRLTSAATTGVSELSLREAVERTLAP